MKRQRNQFLVLGRDIWSIIYAHIPCLMERATLARVCRQFRMISSRDEFLVQARHIRDSYANDPDHCLYVMKRMIEKLGFMALELCYQWFQSTINHPNLGESTEWIGVVGKALECGDDRFLLVINDRINDSQRGAILQFGASHLKIMKRMMTGHYGQYLIPYDRVFQAAVRHNAEHVVRYFINTCYEVLANRNIPQKALEIACIWGHNDLFKLIYEAGFPHVDYIELCDCARRDDNPVILDYLSRQ